jgi:hypothetical protein
MEVCEAIRTSVEAKNRAVVIPQAPSAGGICFSHESGRFSFWLLAFGFELSTLNCLFLASNG